MRSHSEWNIVLFFKPTTHTSCAAVYITSYLAKSLSTQNSMFGNLLQPLNDIIRRQKQTAIQIEQSPRKGNVIFKHYHTNSWRFWWRVFPVSCSPRNWLPDIMRQRLCSSQTASRTSRATWTAWPMSAATPFGQAPPRDTSSSLPPRNLHSIQAQLGLHL